ncbi:hypothetical protein AB0H69_24740 [Streptomyces phaeochromogenes]
MNTIELYPSAVFGPSIMKKFGNAEVAMPSFMAAPSHDDRVDPAR